MEPTLWHGDIVVVRKSDGFWQRWTRKVTVGSEGSSGESGEGLDDIRGGSGIINYHKRPRSNNRNDNNDNNGNSSGNDTTRTKGEDGDENDDLFRWHNERRQVLKREAIHCSSHPSPDLVLRRPPIPVTGDVVVYQDPTAYGNGKKNIKRVVGLGGQMVRILAPLTGAGLLSLRGRCY